MSIPIHKIPSQLPEVWEHNVIFFANLLSMFYGNELGTQELRDEVGSVETYGSRLIPILNLLYKGEDNLLLLEHVPSYELMDYFSHDLGLSLPKIDILTHDDYCRIPKTDDLSPRDSIRLNQFTNHSSSFIDGYVTEPWLYRWSELIHKPTVSSLAGGERGNNKLLLHQYMESQNCPIFDTVIAETFTDLKKAQKELADKGYQKIVVKAQIGASGIGLVKMRVDEERALPAYLLHEGPCMVQGWIDEILPGVKVIGSPSVQMLIKPNDIFLHDVTHQILSSDSVHSGNVAPPEYCQRDSALEIDLLNQAEMTANWLHQQGYRGTASTDFLVVERGGKTQIYVCEINARVTGATYPTFLAGTFLNEGVWVMRNIRFKKPMSPDWILTILNKNQLLYRPEMSKGVLPINFNCENDQVIKGQFLFLAPTIVEAEQLLTQMRQFNDIEGDYDRD